MFNGPKVKSNKETWKPEQRILLALLRNYDETTTKPIPKYKHPRNWVPPPCLTSQPQKNFFEFTKQLRRHYPYLDTDEDSSSLKMKKNKRLDRSLKVVQKEDNDDHSDDEDPLSSGDQKQEINENLKQLQKELELFKQAQQKLESGEVLSPSLKAIVKKWKNYGEEPSGNEQKSAVVLNVSKSLSKNDDIRLPKSKSNPGKVLVPKRAEKLLKDLEKSFQQAKEEEERLKNELNGLKTDARKPKESSRSNNVKLRISNSHSQYKILALKRKYEDLLQYLARVESETKELRKENEVLHSALKEANQLNLKDKISDLEHELMRCKTQSLRCEEQMKTLITVQEENNRLKDIIERFKIDEEKDQRDRQADEETYNNIWANKVSDMKNLYETAIRGYKEELNSAQAMSLALENQLKNVLQYYERRETNNPDKDPELKDSSKEISPDDEREDVDLLRLEMIIGEKEREIKNLKVAFDHYQEASKRNEELENFQEQLLEKISKLVNGTTNTLAKHGNLNSSVENTIKTCFEDLQSKQSEKSNEIEQKAILENELLKEKLKQSEIDAANLEGECEDFKEQAERLTTKCLLLESKMSQYEAESNLQALKNLPNLLKESESKLLESQTAYQTCVIENKVLEERLRNFTSEIDSRKQRVGELEERIRYLDSSNKKLEQETERMTGKIEFLEEQVERKNKILEKNSTQLEERIREHSSIASHMERLREDHHREIADLKLLHQDCQLQPKLQDLQTQNARQESQLSVLRTEKQQTEKNWRKQVRTLEDQVTQLKLRNSTLQKHLESIQVTYKTMFGLEGNWQSALAPFPTSNLPKHDLVLESNDQLEQ